MNRDRRTADYLLLVFGVISLALLCLPGAGKVQSLRALASYLLDPVPFHGARAVEKLADIPAGAARLISLDEELLSARRKLKERSLLEAEVGALRRENERLRAELGMPAPQGRAVRWARVIGRDPQNWHRSFLVNAGRDEGVTLNAPVLGLKDGELGVVGQVAEVRKHWAKVLLLTDDLSAAAAHHPEKGWEGLVQGQGSARLRMNYLPVEARLETGERIVTSPSSAIFPPGLPIGAISRIFVKDPFLAFQSVEIEPAVFAGALKEVMILGAKDSGPKHGEDER